MRRLVAAERLYDQWSCGTLALLSSIYKLPVRRDKIALDRNL